MWFTVVSQNQYWGTRLRKKLFNMRLPRIIEMSNKNTLIQFITQGDITFSDLKVALSRNRSKTTQEYEKSPDEIPPTEILHCGFEVSKRHTQSHILKCDDCKKFADELVDELETKIPEIVDPPKKRSRRYSTDEKRDYIKTFAINDWDAQKTSDETGVPAGTLRDWAKKAKINLSRRSKTKNNLSTTSTINHHSGTQLGDSRYYSLAEKMKVVNDFDNHESVNKLADAHGVSSSAALDWIRLYREQLTSIELETTDSSNDSVITIDGGAPAPASFVDSSTQSIELESEPMKGNTLGAYSVILDTLKSKRESAIDMAEKAKKEMEIMQRAEGVAKELEEIDSAFDFVLMKRDR
jgi:transposase-like protein